jgi:glyoxylase-like metal-dependent hydrolase (beta-lactamase superfamily II)
MDWTEPGPEEVAPGVHRIPLPLPSDGLKAVNVYAIVGHQTNTLIDGGWRIEAAREALDSALGDLGLTVADFDRCLVTHHHRDHYTMAVDLRRRAGLTVALGQGERANIEAGQIPRIPFQEQRGLLRAGGAASVIRLLDQKVWESIDPRDFEYPDHWLDDGEQITLDDRTLRVRTTPGHTQGHVVFIDDDAELMFAGDHILPHITPSVGFQAAAAQAPLADYLSSLAGVSTSRTACCFPPTEPREPVRTRALPNF